MTGRVHAEVWAGPLLVSVVLATGIYLVAVADIVADRVVAGRRPGVGVFTDPVRRAALLVNQQDTTTERPDAALRDLAPATYISLAALGLTVVPWSSTFSVADIEAGIVLWGAVEALVVVAAFLAGWSPNSHQPLLAAYRFVGAGLSYLLLSMFVLIAAALPAESLRVGAIVDAQHGLWNVVRQPLGLPLFAVVALGSTFWGPVGFAGGHDLADGVNAEASGPRRLVWDVGRAAMLTTFSAFGAAMFLGGWQGPWLSGPAWMVLKTVGLLAALVATRHLFARMRTERFVTLCWTVFLPLGFLDLGIAGVGTLL